MPATEYPPDRPPFPVVDGNYKLELEPVVRIGVVLHEDARPRLSLTLPSGARISHGETAGAHPVAIEDATMCVAESRGAGVELSFLESSRDPIRTEVLRVTGVERAGGAGEGVYVRNVVAGRGFHWQKKIDQTLSGTIELRSREGRMILINELPIEEYLIGVITGEMSGECPEAYMKAQAVAARSWLLAQPRPPHPGEPFLWCNDDCCQRYQGTGGWTPRAVETINQCRGEVLITASDQYCDARYSKNTGGISEDAHSVWGYPIEGLTSVVDAPAGSEVERFFPVGGKNILEYLKGDWLKRTDAFASPNVVPEDTIIRYLGRVDEPGTYFRWEKKITQEQMRESLKRRAGLREVTDVLALRPGTRGRSGRLETLDVEYRDRGGVRRVHTLKREYHVRAGLSPDFLYSAAFIIESEKRSGEALSSVTLAGGGWGHGAGLCQIGGLGRSLRGQEYREILLHYYSGTRIERIYS